MDIFVYICVFQCLQMSFHCLALSLVEDRQGVPHIIFIICIMWQKNDIILLWKNTENQKLVEQMLTRN